MILIKHQCEGFKDSHWQTWKEDPVGVQEKLSERIVGYPLEDSEDHRMYHLKMRMPMMATNRSALACFYEHRDSTTGYRSLFHSSKGNEYLLENEDIKSAIGADVMANDFLTYLESKPYPGGMELNHVISLDIVGFLPSFIKNKLVGRLATMGL